MFLGTEFHKDLVLDIGDGRWVIRSTMVEKVGDVVGDPVGSEEEFELNLLQGVELRVTEAILCNFC